jgi:hypothetical protein
MLHQEPWWHQISAREDDFGEACSAGWKVLLPKNSAIPPDCRPRVLAYTRANTDLEIIQRTDIAEDLDIQILGVKCQGANQQVTRLINIYNAPDGAIDLLRQLELDPTTPTIIMGDWNLRNPDFRAMRNNQNPNECAILVNEWLATNGFTLRNK